MRKQMLEKNICNFYKNIYRISQILKNLILLKKEIKDK